MINAGKWSQQTTMTRDQVWSYGMRLLSRIVWVLFAATVGIGCSPRVMVEVPNKPIEINVNMKIEHEVRVKLDETVKRTLEENPELFGTETKP